MAERAPSTPTFSKASNGMGNHALIFGATGIQGWAATKEILRGYPAKSAFSKVTALTNRPFTGEILWPFSTEGKLQTISGIDLLTTDVKDQLSSRVPEMDTVTHVFFCAYISKQDPKEEIEVNLSLMKNAITAVEAVAKNLTFVTMSTGTKAYGVHCLDKFPFKDQTPLSESLPRIPEPWRSDNFYYHQTDWLAEQSKVKSWTWCELRPDIIVGFVPNNNYYNLGQALALYLACLREIEGEGAECIFPGNSKSWKCLSTDSGQDTIARFAIHAALHPETCGQGQAFNVASHSKPSSWSERWPIVCEFFGLKGVGPPAEGNGPLPDAYLSSHIEQWKETEKKYGLAKGRVGNDRTLTKGPNFVMARLDFDRHMDLARQHAAWSHDGQIEELDTKEVWWTAFQRYRDAKIIP